MQALLPPGQVPGSGLPILGGPRAPPTGSLEASPGQIFRDRLANGQRPDCALGIRPGLYPKPDLGMLDFERLRGIQNLAPCGSTAQREEGPMAFIMFEPPLHGPRLELTDAGHGAALHVAPGPSPLSALARVRPAGAPLPAAVHGAA